jgi:hypothetical protein
MIARIAHTIGLIHQAARGFTFGSGGLRVNGARKQGDYDQCVSL